MWASREKIGLRPPARKEYWGAVFFFLCFFFSLSPFPLAQGPLRVKQGKEWAKEKKNKGKKTHGQGGRYSFPNKPKAPRGPELLAGNSVP